LVTRNECPHLGHRILRPVGGTRRSSIGYEALHESHSTFNIWQGASLAWFSFGTWVLGDYPKGHVGTPRVDSVAWVKLEITIRWTASSSSEPGSTT
jgi:hypothetical protein